MGAAGWGHPESLFQEGRGLRGCRRSVRDAELSGVLGQEPPRPALGEEDEVKERVGREGSHSPKVSRACS